MLKLFCVLIVTVAAWPTLAAASPQKDAVVRFYELREKTLDQRGTIKDVDGLLSLLTDEARFEHPVASVVMTKAQARSGMLAHLREGRTQNICFAVLVLRMISQSWNSFWNTRSKARELPVTG